MPNWDICRASHRRPFSERVAARTVVNESTGCIEWIGYRNAKGYGRVTYKGRRELVHRAVWLNEKGAIPAGICVCHRCDNPPCCNIAHLFLGTVADNNKDRARKGRSRSHRLGRRNAPSSRVKQEDVSYAVAAYRAGSSMRRIGKELGVCHHTVRRMIDGEVVGHKTKESNNA